MTTTVHVWGFFNEDGTPRKPTGAAASDTSPLATWTNLESHLSHFGHPIDTCRRTYCGSDLIGVELETAADAECAAMWHTITLADAPWPWPLPERKVS